ncbi:YgjV family protein [Candidatus Gracilibacteria bacterium]|nr:YgjV family protein [Candidatus Gracilibacteria bacterium]
MEYIISVYLENPIGQTMGIMGLLSIIWAFLQEEDGAVKKILVVSNFFWLFHFISMGLLVGVCIKIIGIARLLLSFKYHKNIKIFYGVIFLTIITGILTFEDSVSLFPITASIMATYAFFFLEKAKLRLVLLLCSSCWLHYHYVHDSIGGIITEIILHVTHIITIYKIMSHEGDLENYIEKVKSIFHKTPNIDYGRYLAIIDTIHRKKHKNIFLHIKEKIGYNRNNNKHF